MGIFLKNCIDCGELFKGGESALICEPCMEKNRSDWDKVRAYLHTHKEVTAGACAEATGVPDRVIRLFIKQERIRIVG